MKITLKPLIMAGRIQNSHQCPASRLQLCYQSCFAVLYIVRLPRFLPCYAPFFVCIISSGAHASGGFQFSRVIHLLSTHYTRPLLQLSRPCCLTSACAFAIPQVLRSRDHLITAAFSAPSIRRYSHHHVISRASNHAVILPVPAPTRTWTIYHPYTSISYCFPHHWHFIALIIFYIFTQPYHQSNIYHVLFLCVVLMCSFKLLIFL